MTDLGASRRQTFPATLPLARLSIALALAMAAALPGVANASHAGSNSLGGGQISGAIGTEKPCAVN